MISPYLLWAPNLQNQEIKKTDNGRKVESLRPYNKEQQEYLRIKIRKVKVKGGTIDKDC